MANASPILILEDDAEDIEIMEQAFEELGVSSPRKYFDDGAQFIAYLKDTAELPFLIISDIRVGVMNGLELRDEIQKDAQLRRKGIPFIFLTSDARKKIVEHAYELTVHGFFEKQHTVQGIKQQLDQIVQYWTASKHPNSTF